MNVMMNQNTGTSEEFKYVYGTKPANVYASGVFDGATLTLQTLSPNGDWIDVSDSDIFEPSMVSMQAYPFKGRFLISNESANTSITVDLVGQVVT